MLDPYADLTPTEEAASAQAERQVSAKALRQAAERDAAWAKEQAQMERVTPPRPPAKPVKSRPDQPADQPIIDPDADEHNANWRRILAQRRQQQDEQQKEPPTNG